jgi:regulatory protein
MQAGEYEKAKIKIASYCAYQERCQQEVRNKLYTYQLVSSQVEELLSWLITENYLNEERFSIAFAGGKFRIKKWGKIKIRQALKQKKISEYCIQKSLKEISEKDYLNVIKILAQKKRGEYSLKLTNQFQLKNKTAKYIISKGFSPDIVWEVLKKWDDY